MFFSWSTTLKPLPIFYRNNENNIQHVLSRFNLGQIDVTGDGTCFYHAIQQLLTGKRNDGHALRRRFAEFLLRNEIMIQEHPLLFDDEEKKKRYVAFVFVQTRKPANLNFSTTPVNKTGTLMTFNASQIMPMTVMRRR